MRKVEAVLVILVCFLTAFVGFMYGVCAVSQHVPNLQQEHSPITHVFVFDEYKQNGKVYKLFKDKQLVYEVSITTNPNFGYGLVIEEK